MNVFEEKTKRYFDPNGFLIEKISVGETKTPDFKGDEILVEVKAVQPQELEGCHKDSTYNAIKNNLQNAARKFRDYDPEHCKRHFIVIFFDEENGYLDIKAVWEGKLTFSISLKSGMTISSQHKKYIDAIAWFNKKDDLRPKHILIGENDDKKYFPDVR